LIKQRAETGFAKLELGRKEIEVGLILKSAYADR